MRVGGEAMKQTICNTTAHNALPEWICVVEREIRWNYHFSIEFWSDLYKLSDNYVLDKSNNKQYSNPNAGWRNMRIQNAEAYVLRLVKYLGLTVTTRDLLPRKKMLDAEEKATLPFKYAEWTSGSFISNPQILNYKCVEF